MRCFEVYLHTSPSGRAYVGITSAGMRARWRGHTHAARHGSPTAFHRAIRKYGPAAFTHRVLDVLSTPSGAQRAEQLWIRELGTQASGYNETSGGGGTLGLSPEARAKIGATHRNKKVTEETRDKLRVYNLGRKRGPHSAEHVRRIAEALRGPNGRKASPETRARMCEAHKRWHAEHGTSPEGRAKQAESMRQVWAKKRAK